jgi:predicted alpha-1,6-mannanase (GH76 family)
MTFLFFIASVFTSGLHDQNPTSPYRWAATADSLQETTYNKFISANGQYFIQNTSGNTTFNYWWNAHALDVLVDGYLRTKNPVYKPRMITLLNGVKTTNGGALPNEYYDDMEWMALACLRAHNATGDAAFLDATVLLWTDIQGAWNLSGANGGLAWRKTQLDYKNTPANAPAVILAARLYRLNKKATDLEWAKRIYTWLRATLVDPTTGLVWDGINREGNGQIDKGWKFTYNQGIFIGAALELYKITGEQSYLSDAIHTADYAISNFTINGILRPEGKGDAGLFKGILIRYLAILTGERKLPAEKRKAYHQFLRLNAETLYLKGLQRPALLIDANWTQAPVDGTSIDLSTQLSGLMLIETAAVLNQHW